MYLRNVEFDEAETIGVVGQLFVGQAGEVFAVRWSTAEEEGSSDDVVDVAVLISQGAVEGQTFQFGFLVTDESNGIVEGIDGLDEATDSLLHGGQGLGDDGWPGWFSRLDEQDFHGHIPPENKITSQHSRCHASWFQEYNIYLESAQVRICFLLVNTGFSWYHKTNLRDWKEVADMNDLKIPVGVSDFAKIRNYKYYYVDKTGLIEDLLEKETAEVTLITRPRRFGKTMGMSMLDNFFDIRKDSKAIFEGLEISQNTELCSQWMNQWPVLFLSFKEVNGTVFDHAFNLLKFTLAQFCDDHAYLTESEKVTEEQKRIFRRLNDQTASLTDVQGALLVLMKMMRAYYGKPVILLLDEYDVPIAKASANGYYTEMLEVIRGMMSTALKDNDALRFAVITGCLRIAKESIFTGTNNFVSDTISSSHLNESFGFTQADIDQILKDADCLEHAADIKNWYDGYHFGDLDVYCPWDVMNYLRDLQRNPKAKPASYWKNTSDNSIIRSFIDYRGAKISQKLETLLSGGYILQKVEEDLTYDYLHSSEENLWSILYLTGYLTRVREEDLPAPLPEDASALIIPNAEVREIFETTIQKWFDESAQTWNLTALFDAMWSGNAETLTAEINKLLYKTISYHDYKEDFYHAFLTGILAGSGCAVKSNREHGEGRSDIVIYHPDRPQVILFEAKYAKTLGGLQKSCAEALQQIEDRQYAKEFEDDYDSVLCYGIAFYKKRCLVQIK